MQLKGTESINGASSDIEDPMEISAISAEDEKRPKTEMESLLQYLQSDDEKSSPALERIINESDEEFVLECVRKIPHSAVIPLLGAIRNCMSKFPFEESAHGLWLKLTLSHHNEYLTDQPNKETLLRPICELLEKKAESYAKIVNLKGKLDLIKTQIQSRANPEHAQESNPALFIIRGHNDEDELSDVLDELLHPASDVEDAFDDLGNESDDIFNDE